MSQWTTLHFTNSKRPPMTGPDCHHLLSIGLNPIYLEGSQVQCLPGLQESLWTSIHYMVLVRPGMTETLMDSQEVGMGGASCPFRRKLYLECVSMRLDSVHRGNEFIVGKGNFLFFFSSFPPVALATLLCRLG